MIKWKLNSALFFFNLCWRLLKQSKSASPPDDIDVLQGSRKGQAKPQRHINIVQLPPVFFFDYCRWFLSFSNNQVIIQVGRRGALKKKKILAYYHLHFILKYLLNVHQ